MTRRRVSRRTRVVIAGLGDTGLLTAIHLARHAELDVVAVANKPGLVSGQEVGLRLARPEEWTRDYRIDFDRFRGLDRVRILRGSLVGVDFEARRIGIVGIDGAPHVERYDQLVIATGVANGFWRQPVLETAVEVEAALTAQHERLAAAHSIAVVGGGAAAVSIALNAARSWPGTEVDLYFPGTRALTAHHPKVWVALERRLVSAGVGLHPGHRAVVPEEAERASGAAAGEGITVGPVVWSTGQRPADADAVVWAIGRVRPNTGWLPGDILDDDGFVRVDQHLQVQRLRVRSNGGLPHMDEADVSGGSGSVVVDADLVTLDGVWAIGDVAATDPLRTSARSRADHLLARNIRATATATATATAGATAGASAAASAAASASAAAAAIAANDGDGVLGGLSQGALGRRSPVLRAFTPAARRWGSVVGPQDDALEVFTPKGQRIRIRRWSILQPWVVRRAIYRGIRR